MGGVPTRIWFDNASSMVASIHQDGKRKMRESFARFVNHYGFEAVFCNKGAGIEKGNVENRVGYLRRNYLGRNPGKSGISSRLGSIPARASTASFSTISVFLPARTRRI